MSEPQNLNDQMLTWLPKQWGKARHWVKDLWQWSAQEDEADQSLLQIAGSLSGEPLSVNQIEAELYG